MLSIAIVAVVAYLAGSIPFGFLVARAKGIDIRTVGSRNIGATNVFRVLGRGPGVLTFLLDVLKGYVSAALLPAAAAAIAGAPPCSPSHFRLLGGVFAVLGHSWPVFLGFKGGKGVATSAGMLLGVAPGAVGLAFAAWIAVFLVSRYVSVASIAAAAVLAALTWAPRFRADALTSSLLSLLALAVIVRHRANIRRLLDGTESRFAPARAAGGGAAAAKNGGRRK